MRTRFAPSPTGPLHLGHAFSALTAHDLARAAGGEFLLRIEDIDRARSKAEFETMLLEDLAWLGLRWPEPVLRQSHDNARFRAGLARLDALGLIYPCSCSRRDIAQAAGAPQEGVPSHGPDGRIYPGICRNRRMSDTRPDDAIRLDVARAVAFLEKRAGSLPVFEETGPVRPGIHRLDRIDFPGEIGDVVVARKGQAPAYHLAAVLDDAAQGITLVVRGMDLFEATAIHVLLQALLGLPVPNYHHHRLVRDDQGRRLAKRDDARALRQYRDRGLSPEALRRMLGLPPDPGP
ncbi:MAG: tRNA glutamyl-Q(34) synthetase GluQRS [Pseudomonadota bacterium]